MKRIVHMHATHEDAVRKFRSMEEYFKGRPDIEFNRTSLTMTGQGMEHRYMSIHNPDKLRGMEISMIFIDEVGPFYGREHLDGTKF